MISMRFCLLSATAIMAMSVGCTNSLESLPDGQQSQSTLSPDGITRAFVWVPKMSGGLGATVSQSHQVWIENTRMAGKRLMVEADKTDGLKLTWISVSTLEVCYADAQIFRFLNKFDFANEQSPEIISVEIVLRRMKTLDMC